MLILAVDTTNALGSLALLDGERVLEEMALDGPEGFGQILFQSIVALLGRHNVSLAAVDLFAGAAGPGTFTGVRVGLAAVKGLAEASGQPAAAISNLRALASFGSAECRAVWMDARRGEIYGAVYDASLALVQPEVVMPLEAFAALLPEGCELIAPVDGRLLAAAIGRIAGRQGGVDPAGLDANYVRRSDAELLLKPSV